MALVLITGATSGIGKSCAVIFAKNGYDLLLTGRRGERLTTIKKELEATYNINVFIFTFDISDRKAVAAFAENIEAQKLIPDILINNAGLASGRNKLQEGDIADWEKMIDTNVKGLLYITRHILPMMIKRNNGHIVNIGSTAGHFVYPEGNVYNATKFAVNALNQGINMDLVGTNIRCCSVDPGACETEFSIVRFHGDEDKANKVYEGYTPLSPDDVADTIFYIVNTPPHVNILNVVIQPTAQRSVFVIDKKV